MTTAQTNLRTAQLNCDLYENRIAALEKRLQNLPRWRWMKRSTLEFELLDLYADARATQTLIGVYYTLSTIERPA